MRTRGQAMRGRAQRGRTARTASIPAPIGGLNARDSIANMKPTDAVKMDNFVPNTTSVDLRPGYASWQTGYASPIFSLMSYKSPTTQKLFAASGNSIYDATTAGAVGAAVVTGQASAKWQYVNFGTAGGNFLYAVDGASKALLYDGTKWISVRDGVGATISSITHVGTTATVTTSTAHGLVSGQTVTVVGAAPADYNVTTKVITVLTATTFTYVMATNPASNATSVGTYTYGTSIQGVDTALLKDVQVYARRLWFVEKNSFRVWYLPVTSIGGTAASIDLASLYVLGGSLQGMVVWTVASELSTTSYAAFVSSEGEVMLYTGINPDAADGFNLVGTFRIGKPIGQRFYARTGSDTLLITQDGLIPLSKAVMNNRANQSDAVSFKIEKTVSDDITEFGSQFGWQVILYPVNDRIFLNAPRGIATDNVQYVMNTITNAWCRYTGLPANCFVLHDDKLFFGDGVAIYQAETGMNDNGAGIPGDVIPAFSYFGARGTSKLFTAARPIVTASGEYRPSLSLALDFKTNAPSSSPELTTGLNGAPWDTSPWDVSTWGDVERTGTRWQTLGGIGFAASIRMRSITKDVAVQWQSVDFVYELGTGIY